MSSFEEYIPIIISFGVLVLAFLTYNKKSADDISSIKSDIAVIKADLRNTAAMVAKNDAKFETHTNEIQKIHTRLITTENKVNAAHARIDRLEDKEKTGDLK